MAAFNRKRGQPMPRPTGGGAGIGQYLKAAFLFRWNVLLFLGAGAAALLSPWAGVLVPLVAAGELSYLAGLVSVPRFRAAIDAKVHQQSKARTAEVPAHLQSVADIVGILPGDARLRFERLRDRCLEMRSIARGVGGRADGADHASEIRTPSLNRLLWVFLRLLLSQDALSRFLQTTSEGAIQARLEELRSSIVAQPEDTDERIVRSLEDSVAVSELRLDNYRKAGRNADFVTIELDRIEAKIQALTEMSINRQDPDFLTSQVNSVADSMRQTEQAISELQHITGLTDELEEPPAILESNLREVLGDEA